MFLFFIFLAGDLLSAMDAPSTLSKAQSDKHIEDIVHIATWDSHVLLRFT